MSIVHCTRKNWHGLKSCHFNNFDDVSQIKKWSCSKKVNDLAGEFLQSVLLFQIALKLRKIALELCDDFLSVYAWCP